MTQFYLTRHGETALGRQGILKGQLDVELSTHGIDQAEALATRFENHSPVAIYSSTLKRSQQTAEIVAEPHGLQPEPIPELKERCFGEMEGIPVAEVEGHLLATGIDWNDWRPTAGETRKDVVDRALPVINSLCDRHGTEEFIVVAHGGLNRGLLSKLLCGDPRWGWRIAQDLTCVNKVERRDDRGWCIRVMNDTCHLADNPPQASGPNG